MFLFKSNPKIGSGLKKHFEDGVVKRENLQPNEEVEIARHASRGNWRREKRKTSWGREQYEHVGQDTRSQGGKDDQDIQGKDLKILELKTKSKDNDKGSRSKIRKHEGTSLQQR
ncbi:hypothetical protein Tco_1113154 [Tanacetum coccineum]|uniref:Uncharacterized protein n=1 Tax=Tanacetum coccineum TaxID=301880 RepID=A0ABQ5IRD1_9ASTR